MAIKDYYSRNRRFGGNNVGEDDAAETIISADMASDGDLWTRIVGSLYFIPLFVGR